MKQTILLILSIYFFSCAKEEQSAVTDRLPGCDSLRFTFNTHILPIFTSNCNFTDCHSTSGDGSYDLTKYEMVVNRIKAGTLEYRLDLPVDDPQHMPDKVDLSFCDYFAIKSWIAQGYPEN